MPLTKFAIDFDPTAPTETDRIGSYLIGGTSNTVITDTNPGVLDVNIAFASGLGIYAEDSANASGDLGSHVLLVRQDTLAISTSANGDYGDFKSNDLGELYTHDTSANASLTSISGNTSTLAGAVKLEDAASADGHSGLSILAVRQDTPSATTSADGDYSDIKTDSLGRLWSHSLVFSDVADDAVSSENPIPVGGVAKTTVSALTALSATGDKSELLMDLYRRVFVNDSYNVAWKVTKVTVANTATQVAATALVGRRMVNIINKSGKKVWIKNANTVATDETSVEIDNNASAEFLLGEALPIYAIVASGTADIAVMEAA